MDGPPVGVFRVKGVVRFEFPWPRRESRVAHVGNYPRFRNSRLVADENRLLSN